ncbi:MAG: hypothetical protein U0518_04080 [Candidatus Gracilibacteria bacterium]
MKMQKSTMILSGVLGVISVGSVLMFANPGMQEALVSNIFRSRMYSVPTKPVTPAVINKNPWGVTPSKPSISGEVIVTNKGKYEGFMNGRLFISTASITKEEAYSNCKQNSANNMNSNIRCTWNGVEIFSRGVVPTPSISGEVVIRPSTPTKPVDVLASLTITVDGKNQPAFYNTSKFGETYANLYCTEYAKLVLTTSKFSCIWNGKELSKGYGTKVVTGTSTGTTTTPKPATPVSTGSSTSTGAITLGTLTINTNFSIDKSARYNIAETEAKAVCESTWRKYENDPKSTQLTCIWNGKTIFSKTKPSSSNSGSISTGTVVVPKIPVNTGSTASGVITPTKPADVLASITVTVDGKNQPDIYNTYKLNEKEAINYCAELASRFPASSKFSCVWNGTKELSKGYGTRVVTNTGTTTTTTPKPTTPATPAGTGSSTSTGAIPLGTLTIQTDFLIDKSGRYNIAEIEAKAICESTWKKYESDPKSTYLTCIWNGKTIFSQVKTTPAGAGSTSTGAIPLGTLTIQTDFLIDKSGRYNIAEIEAKAICESTWKKYESDPKSTYLTCIWNGKTIFSQVKTTPAGAGSTSTGVTSSGSTTSLGKMDMWVNNQAWNPEYNISESGALTRCTNYLPSIPTSSVVLCKWNGTTIYSGGGTKTVANTNTGSTSTGSLK